MKVSTRNRIWELLILSGIALVWFASCKALGLEPAAADPGVATGIESTGTAVTAVGVATANPALLILGSLLGTAGVYLRLKQKPPTP